MLRFMFFVTCLAISDLSAENFIVNRTSTATGSDGSLGKPFTSIQACVDKLKARNKPGDECQIRSGNYHENIKINGLHGKPGKEFVIKGYGDERPLLDGTIEIKSIGSWKQTGNIFSAQISSDIWQLFVDGQMMTNARWPNSKWSDYSIFDGSYWAKLRDNSTRGRICNLDSSLANTRVSMKGAIVLLNIGSFNTYVAKVKSHNADSNDFEYDDTFGGEKFTRRTRFISKYFFEDKLELLDAAEEWYFNNLTRILHLWTPDGKHPDQHKIRGKVQTYAMEITSSSNIIIKNLDFYGTTMSADSITNILFHSLNFEYPSYSKRMSGDIELIKKTTINIGQYTKTGMRKIGTFELFNSTFYGSDGMALEYAGKKVTVDNNLFAYNDWTGANMLKYTGGSATMVSKGKIDRYTRNTLLNNGESHGLRPAAESVVYMNNVEGQCWGLLLNDGAGIHITTNRQPKSNTSYNWVHHSPKYGIRFDGQPPSIGTEGTMSHNVAFKTGGLMVKGDNHTVLNNLAFHKYSKIIDGQGTGCTLCVLKYVRSNAVMINNYTVVNNNLADVATGGNNAFTRGAPPFHVPGKLKNNAFGVDISTQLMDPYNFDFRPVSGSKTEKNEIGPYKYVAKMKRYWIPGRVLYKASTPIPTHNSKNVTAARRDALMWLHGYGCEKHEVYFGLNKDQVNKAVKGSTENIGSTIDSSNVQYLTTKVLPATTYYWRVDAENKSGDVYKGDIWVFKTK